MSLLKFIKQLCQFGLKLKNFQLILYGLTICLRMNWWGILHTCWKRVGGLECIDLDTIICLILLFKLLLLRFYLQILDDCIWRIQFIELSPNSNEILNDSHTFPIILLAKVVLQTVYMPYQFWYCVRVYFLPFLKFLCVQGKFIFTLHLIHYLSFKVSEYDF